MGAVQRWAAVWAGTLAAACYQPSPPGGAPCSRSGECPAGQACVAGVCGGTTAGTDAPPDIPPGAVVMTIGEQKSQIRDAEIWDLVPDLGKDNHFSVDDTERGVLWFDLSSVPEGKQVARATLTLFTSDDADERGGTVLVYRLLEQWDEETVNWVMRTAEKAWASPGAGPPSRGETPVATLQPDREDTAFEIGLPTDLVEAWLADPASNFGLVFVRGTSEQHVHFGTRESPSWSKLTLALHP